MDVRSAPRNFRLANRGRRKSEAPVPGGDDESFWDLMERAAIIGIFVLLVVGALIYSRPVALPVFCAIIIGSIVGSLVDALVRRGVPSFAAAGAIVLALFAGVYGLAIAFTAPISTWIGRAPEIGSILRERFQIMRQPLEMLNEIQNSIASMMGEKASALTVDTSASILESVLAVATPALSQFFVFVGTLIFFLAGRTGLKRRLVVAFGSREGRLTMLRIITNVEQSLGRYLGTVTLINAGLGVATGIAMAIIGVPNPGLWGLLAFTMNYIPFIGPAIVALVLFAVGIMSFNTFGGAVLVPAVYLGLHWIESQFVTPNVLGRSLTLNPFVVFVALAFWAWIWGPVGAFIAVPVLVTAVVVFDNLFPRDEVALPG